MRRHQRGITTLGWLILLVPVAIVFYAGIRVTPIYLNYMKVAKTLEKLSTEVPNESATVDSIRATLYRHYEIDLIEYPDVKDIKITRADSVWHVEANYDDQAPLFANIFILITFDKTVKLKSGGE